MSVTANGDRMKTVALSFSHTEVAHGSLLQRDFLEKACTFALLGALVGDAYPYLAGIVVFIEPHHLPFFLVKGIITGYCARVRRNLQIDGRYGEPFMVVVVGSPLGAHRDDTVVSALVLFKSELLPHVSLAYTKRSAALYVPSVVNPGVTLAVSVKGWLLSTSVSRIGRVVLLNCPPLGSQKKSSFSVQRNSIARPSFTVTQVSAPLSAPVKVMPSMRTSQEATLAETCRRVSRDLFHMVFSLILLLAALRSQSGSDKCREDKCFSHKWYDYIGVV